MLFKKGDFLRVNTIFNNETIPLGNSIHTSKNNIEKIKKVTTLYAKEEGIESYAY